MLQHVLTIFIASALINNFVFSRYLGLCIFFGVTKKMETAVGMSFTFTAVMLISAMLNWIIYNYVMIPYHLGFLEDRHLHRHDRRFCAGCRHYHEKSRAGAVL